MCEQCNEVARYIYGIPPDDIYEFAEYLFKEYLVVFDNIKNENGVQSFRVNYLNYLSFQHCMKTGKVPEFVKPESLYEEL